MKSSLKTCGWFLLACFAQAFIKVMSEHSPIFSFLLFWSFVILLVLSIIYNIISFIIRFIKKFLKKEKN